MKAGGLGECSGLTEEERRVDDASPSMLACQSLLPSLNYRDRVVFIASCDKKVSYRCCIENSGATCAEINA